MNSFTAVSEINQGPRVVARFGRADRGDRAFRAAVRHSRHVRILRVAVPLTTVVVFLSGVAFTVLMKPLRVLSDVDVSLVVSGTKIKMNQPRLAGVTRDNRRYDMVAQAAAQDFTKAHMVELDGIRATMEMRDNVIFETTAKGGLYNIKTKQLTLTQNIVVTSSSGYQAFLNEAVVDVPGSKITSEKPVEVKTATWTINANRMEVADSGDLMRFERGVFVTPVTGIIVACAICGSDATAQKNPGPPNTLQGFSQNRDEPVKIRAESLELREKDKMATFTGGVYVLQGDTEMHCKQLVVFYGEETGTRTVKAADPLRATCRQLRSS
jgi:lipopolysaccharide export system protein LptC